MTRRALITGIAGQDGYYLADLLLKEGYQVHGMLRPQSNQNLSRIKPLCDRIQLHEADMTDSSALLTLIDKVRPAEIYNLAAISFIPDCWSDPLLACDVMGAGVTRILEAIRAIDPKIRFCQAGSSEIFGRTKLEPQTEQTAICPRNPYGTAKAYAHTMVENYRHTYGMFACSAIQFNHESPLRSRRFVTRKITHTVAEIKLGLCDKLRLGDLEAQRDWGYAADYVRAMWLMLQRDVADDFIIATGKQHCVRDLAQMAFDHVGLDYQKFVEIDPRFVRAKEVNTLRGDISKARSELDWEPTVSLEELVQMMVDADLERISPTSIEK